MKDMSSEGDIAATKVQYYDQFADKALDSPPPIDGRVRKAESLFRKHLGHGRRLLDIGCSDGGIAAFLGQALGAEEVRGVEVSPRWVELAHRRGVEAAVFDVESGPLPYTSGSFDAIFCGEIIEHLVDPDHLLDEIRRLLTPQGLCVLTTPNLAAWVNRVALALGYQPFSCGVSFRHDVGRMLALGSASPVLGHLRVFSHRALKELLSTHGFRIVDMAGLSTLETMESVPRGRLGLLLRLVHPLDRLLSLRTSLALDLVVAIRP
ncbi:MAG: class I SAM-dependent methyltransferase [Dehalococcoidia bacterium]